MLAQQHQHGDARRDHEQHGGDFDHRVGIAGGVERLHRDGGRRRGYQGENARRRLAGDRLKISPARDVSGQRVLSEETCKKCPFYVGSREVSGSRSVARFARLEQAGEQKRVAAET